MGNTERSGNLNGKYWSSAHPIKRLADIGESVLGAVFLDSGMKPAGIQKTHSLVETGPS
jgi:hypothetical protein